MRLQRRTNESKYFGESMSASRVSNCDNFLLELGPTAWWVRKEALRAVRGDSSLVKESIGPNHGAIWTTFGVYCLAHASCKRSVASQRLRRQSNKLISKLVAPVILSHEQLSEADSGCCITRNAPAWARLTIRTLGGGGAENFCATRRIQQKCWRRFPPE